MRQCEITETIHDGFVELAALHAAAAAVAKRVYLAIAEHSRADLRGTVCAKCCGRQPPPDRPLVDAAAFAVEWRGRRCTLGPGVPFRLLYCLARRPDRYYSYEALMAGVWNRRCANSTIRTAVKRLRRRLCDAGMDDLVKAIKGRGECYGMFLSGSGL